MTEPQIGILCWEEGKVPKGLRQLEELKGNSTNPASFDFPLYYSRIEGANLHTVLEKPDEIVLQKMIVESNSMAKIGIKAITTSCGFNAIFQRELAQQVSVPVFTSSLMQIPLLQNMIGFQDIGIITASKNLLSQEHLQQCGVNDFDHIHIEGLDDCKEWQKVFDTPEAEIDVQAVEEEVLKKVLHLKDQRNIKCLILECTDLPPFANRIRKETGLPVFDFVTMTNYIQQSII